MGDSSGRTSHDRWPRAPVGDIIDLRAGSIEVTGVDLTGTIIEPKELEKISKLINLERAVSSGAELESWRRLAAQRQRRAEASRRPENLEKLQFSLHFLTHVNVRDEGIAQIAGLTQLKELRCAQCQYLEG